jgi:hypothetical protein
MHKEEDYFIPALAPYVQWVRAYRGLISALYEEHKTVRKAWKAFRDAIPGVEQRLQFALFEQILLFSLFLSEWNESEAAESSDVKVQQTKPGSKACQGKDIGSDLDTVIQDLQKTIFETDRALADFNLHHEQNALILRDQESHLETRVNSLEKSLEMLMSEMKGQDEHLGRVIQEIAANVRPQRVAIDGKLDGKEGFVQAVMQWSRQGAAQGVIQNSETKLPLKKIGRWNAQRSRDGYYRLYRKIGGRVHSIYIGKELDLDKAERRIADRERELLRSDTAADGIENTNIKGQIKMGAPLPVVSVPGDDN